MPRRLSNAQKRKPPRRDAKKQSVFLNIPYDNDFENLFLAYIAGISAFGFIPRAAVEVPYSSQRLDRLLSIIREYAFSIHDLSRVELDRTPPRTPRFNLPFELGLVVGLQASLARHQWVVCETRANRFEKSLSDLKGTDAYIHEVEFAGYFGNSAIFSSGESVSGPSMR